MSDRIVAARGQLYINARSPKDDPASKVPSDSPAIVISDRPTDEIGRRQKMMQDDTL